MKSSEQVVSPILIIQVCILGMVLFLSLYAFKTGQGILLIPFALVPLLFLSMNRNDLWLFSIVCLFLSGIRIPGLPGGVLLFHVGVAGLLVLLIAGRMIVKQRVKPIPDRYWVYLFLAILFVTIAVRGTGFRALGDNKWGGVRYVQIITPALLLLMCTQVRLSTPKLRWALIGLCLMAVLPLMSQLLFVISGGAIYHQYYFIKPVQSVAGALETFETGEMTRFKVGNTASKALCILPFILFPFRGKYKAAYAFIILVALVIGGFSGHRLTLIHNILFLGTCGFLFARYRFQYVVQSFAALFVCLVITIILAPHLPLSIQRAVSWIPFTKVDPMARWAAETTIDWRLMVWKLALDEIPKYWLIGKGYTFDIRALETAMLLPSRAYSVPFINVAYHNGILSMIIGMGVAGIMVTVGFLISMLVRHFKLIHREWDDVTRKRLFTVLYSWFVVEVFVFLFLYGDVFVSMPRIFFIGALLYVTSSEGLHAKRPSEGRVGSAGFQQRQPASRFR